MSKANGAIGVFTLDRELKVRSWDRWLEQATGLAEGDVCGRELTGLFPEIAQRGLLAPLRRVVDTGTVEVLAPAFHRYLVPCPPRAPSQHFERMQQHVTIAPLRAAQGTAGAIVTIEDVTARLDRERTLAQELRSADEDVRLRAARTLATEHARPELLGDALGDPSWRVRDVAATGLAEADDERAIELLISALRDRHRDSAVLNAAVVGLVRSSRRALPRVLELLREQDSHVRTYAALALGQMGDAGAVQPLLHLLATDPDVNVRYHALEALGRLRAREAAPAICSVAEGEDEFLAFAALEALGELGEPSVASRVQALLDRPGLNAAAASALGRLADEEVAPALAERMNQPGADVPTLAAALAGLHDRLEATSGAGGLVSDAARAAIDATGMKGLAAALACASDGELPPLVTVLGWLDFDGIPALLAPLLDQAPVRALAAAALVRRRAEAVPLLLEALDADDPETRKAAARALGEIGSPIAVAALCAQLDESPGLAIVAAGALGAIGDRRSFEPLLAQLDHPDAAVRQAAIAALHSIGHPDTRPRVGELLAHPSPRVREAAVRIASYFGYPEALPVLLERCTDEEESVRRVAVEQIASFEDAAALPALDRALEDTAGVRAAAARALAHIEAGAALPRLERALADADPWVRYHAVRSLSAHGGQQLLAPLSELALTDPAPPVRVAATDALGRMRDPTAATALCALAAALPDVARAAVAALGRTPGAEALAGLLAALDEPDAGVRLAAVEALGERGDAGAVARLRELAERAREESLRQAALAALGRIGGAPAVAALVDACSEDGTQPAAIDALARLPGEELPQVASALRHPDARVRRAVVEALARRRDGRAAPLLAEALADGAALVRVAAAHALRRLDLRAVERQLELMARAGGDAEVREAARSVLQP